ncbi:PcfJ domain-containing protein [Rhizobium sp. BK176]|uniref:PcfJ domain-containing protein n=1 Tax=Rhizobium sp. BK176 TaxID=2587071 RepID=UPI002167DD3D|nr:PcfJ domain-containing protein [Rhizobium sp. BK176]MCS4089684.1 hypothetical protein [Rhizobium sp. BK176]
MDRQYLQNRIDDYLRKHVDLIERGRRGTDAPDVFPLLRMSVGRVLTNIGVKLDSEVKAIMECALPETRHIYDWLLASQIRGEPWLSRCDPQGRPLKLMKFSTIPQITAEANKAMAKRRGDGFRVPPTSGTEVVHECGDGWTIVRLMTPEALDYEGAQMGHCVGQGGYDHLIEEDPIYSLRDPMGRSHITIEVDAYSKRIAQLKGKQNAAPKIEYTRRLVGWKGLVGLTIDGQECPSGFGLDKRLGLVELGELKSGDVFEGDLWIEWNDKLENPLVLPSGITVIGDVDFRRLWRHSAYRKDQKATPLPNDLTINGKLGIEGMRLDGFNVVADQIVIENSHVKNLGKLVARRIEITDCVFDDDALERSTVKGDLYVKSCRGVAFRDSTTVVGSVSIVDCKAGLSPSPVVWFEDGFRAKGRGALHVDGSFVGFGHSLAVEGDFTVCGDSAVRMPYRLDVYGNLLIEQSEIDHWPETMNVRGLTVEHSARVIHVGRQLSANPSPMSA